MKQKPNPELETVQEKEIQPQDMTQEQQEAQKKGAQTGKGRETTKADRVTFGRTPTGNKPQAFKGKVSVGQDLHIFTIDYNNTDFLGQYQKFKDVMVSVAATNS